jgi:cyclic pyranopterin monophosphate synthase
MKSRTPPSLAPQPERPARAAGERAAPKFPGAEAEPKSVGLGRFVGPAAAGPAPGGLTHFDAKGDAVMVDVSAKAETERVAVAAGSVVMRRETLQRIMAGGVKKGDVLSVARLAGIMGAKRTPDLIPLCHPLALASVAVELSCDPARNAVDIVATVKTLGRTGVEMEALTAVAVAALTVYDMCKAVDRDMTLGDIRLLRKAGGKSGDYERGA